MNYNNIYGEKMIRILHYGMSAKLGGIESFIMSVYRQIDRTKIQFDFIKNENTICFEDEILNMGGKIFEIPSRRNSLLKPYSYLDNHFKNHPEHKILHAHINTCSYISPIISAKKNERKVIVHSHSAWQGTNRITRILHNINQHRLLKNSDILCACSGKAGNYNFGNKDYVIINNGISVNDYLYNEKIRLEMRQELKSEKDLIIGHVGRFSYEKNHVFIIRILREIVTKNKNVKLLLIGDGVEKQLIEAEIEKLNLEKHVIFTGIRHDIPKLLQAMDVFVFPSLFEGLPITLIEAQAAGLPIFASADISKEVAVTNKINFLKRDAGSKKWAEMILKCDKQRANTRNDIIKSGYDIETTTGKLEEKYHILSKD